MVRLLSRPAILLAGVVSTAAFAQTDLTSQHEVVFGADISYVETSGYRSWTEGSVGKLRYDDSSDGLILSRAFVDYRGRIKDTVNANIAVEIYDDELGPAIDLTEAYLEWRPVPRSPNRYRVKVGAFYPRISLENTEAGWSSPYSLSSSTINTWVAEELRTLGAEFSVSRRPQSLGGVHRFGLQVAAFWGNDPAGALLAWKGWSAHDRQSRFSDQLPLPPLPQIQPGMLFAAQDPYVEPFLEIDDRAGFYINGEWQFGSRMLIRAMHYDNRADPLLVEDGQYGWKTKFDHVGAQISLPSNFAIIAQWMTGSTVMGAIVNGTNLIDTEFDSKFVLLTKTVGKHRVSFRYDNFEVTQNDTTPEDNNPEDGLVWTVAYQHEYSARMSFAAEWLSIKTHHCGWVYYGLDPTATEKQLQLSLRFRLGR